MKRAERRSDYIELPLQQQLVSSVCISAHTHLFEKILPFQFILERGCNLGECSNERVFLRLQGLKRGELLGLERCKLFVEQLGELLCRL